MHSETSGFPGCFLLNDKFDINSKYSAEKQQIQLLKAANTASKSTKYSAEKCCFHWSNPKQNSYFHTFFGSVTRFLLLNKS